MAVFVSLPRAVNVGGTGSIRMAALKAIYESLGFERVATLLLSGNVVFAAGTKDEAELARRIAAAIEKEAGFRPGLILDLAESVASG